MSLNKFFINFAFLCKKEPPFLSIFARKEGGSFNPPLIAGGNPLSNSVSFNIL